jgi:hypothetical protein
VDVTSDRPVTVACVLRHQAGCDYDVSYVAKLQAMVARHLHAPHRFVCYSNIDVPCERLPLQTNWPGWWAKMEVFNPEVPGRIFFMDLDTVLTGDITEMARRVDMVMGRCFHGTRTPYASGFMMLPETQRAEVWQRFRVDPHRWMSEFKSGGDQAFITKAITHAATWQEEFPGYLYSYKYECRDKYGDTLPPNTRVVYFHGYPRPAEMPDDHWVKQHWCE